MRILSQDNGKYDLPYENIVLEKMMDCNTIYAYAGTGQPFKMAVYSSAEKMNKAMEMLRNFNEVREVKNIPIKKDVIETMFEPLKKLFKIYTDGGGEFLKMDLVKVGDYFQFPSDDEVEV